MVDSTWTTADEQLTSSTPLIAQDLIRGSLKTYSTAQEQMGLVSWGGYIFHVYEEVGEKHQVELSEYAVPGSNNLLGFRVQNKINKPSEVFLKAMMVTTGVVSAKQVASAPFMSSGLGFSSFFDVFPWVSYPTGIAGIMDKLKQAMYLGWALPYIGKYGRINNMALISVESLDNEQTVYACPLKLHLRQVLGINHRISKGACTCPIQVL